MLRCFSQKLAGGWTGGGPGLGKSGKCTKEDRINDDWPCYTEQRPVVYCSGKYWDDYKYKKVSKDKTPMVFGFEYFMIVFKHDRSVFFY